MYNQKLIAALKKVNACKWNGSVTFPTLEEALVSIRLYVGADSGWYVPKGERLAGLEGVYMLHENGALCYEARAVKDAERWRVEYLSNSGCYEVERHLLE